MSSKSPSSLDYEPFLHEMALRNWRRALLDGDAARAESNASRLATSHDRLWRFIGLLHQARARLCRGKPSPALDALAEARRSYPEAQELGNLARLLAAHIQLEVGSPRSALAELASIDLFEDRPDSIEARYWCALAHSRLGERRRAEDLAARCEPSRAAHIRAGLDPASRLTHLHNACERWVPENLASPEPSAIILFALGTARLDASEVEGAESAFGAITASRETLLHWPIPYARSLFRVGRIASKDGREEEARLAFREFLLWWSEGEMDRADVAEAAQFVNA